MQTYFSRGTLHALVSDRRHSSIVNRWNPFIATETRETLRSSFEHMTRIKNIGLESEWFRNMYCHDKLDSRSSLIFTEEGKGSQLFNEHLRRRLNQRIDRLKSIAEKFFFFCVTQYR